MGPETEGKKRLSMEAGVLARVDGSMVKKQGLFMAKKPAKITGTTFIVLVLPLLIAMDREYQLNELDLPERLDRKSVV